MSPNIKVTALAFICLFLLTAFIVPPHARGEVTSLELVPGKYTGNNTFVPGEVMSIIIEGDVVGEIFNVYAVIGEEFAISGGINIQMQPSGSVKVSYEIPLDTPDGTYLIRVKRPNQAIEAETEFNVQGYVFKIETDRNAYLSSDEFRVFWTANNLKDQTLPATGVGRIDIWMQDPLNPDNVSRIMEAHSFNISAGSVAFKLPAIVDYSMSYYVDGWFNSSSVNPIRSQYSKAVFYIKRIGVLISMDKNQYAAGSLMRLTVRTFATDSPANPSITDTPEPGCDITITIKRPGYDPIYSSFGLKTDFQGVLNHIIPLTNESFVDGVFFDVEVTAAKGGKSQPDSVSFEIVSSSSISIVLNFNKAQYASGSTLFVNATATAIGDTTATTFTYILEIRSQSSNGSLLARATQTRGNFSFSIPENFEGLLWVRVTADDGSGNSASVIQQVNVAYALVLVNLDRDFYNPNDQLSITYSIIGTMIGTPSTFYVVYDSEGNVVEEGVTEGGTFNFIIPAAPSSEYQFTVFASAGGRVVQGTDSAFLFLGFLLNLDFNRAYYSPGEIIAVDYNIIVLGNANTPATFTITYGLINGPVSSLQTDQTSGTLIYTIPTNIDEGDQIFMASCNFGATQVSSSEMLFVDSSANPIERIKIWDIPIFSIGLLLLVLLSMYMTYRTRKRIKALENEGLIKPSGLGEALTSKRTHDSLHQVECRECGNPIEITTSRRPIEVMCPHCGEIQHIE